MPIREKVTDVRGAAEELGVSIRRVRALIAAGRLPAEMLGNSYVIARKDLDLVRQRKPGRPTSVRSRSHGDNAE